jgi:signal transduction histidine kinase
MNMGQKESSLRTPARKSEPVSVYIIVLVAFWTLCVGASLWINIDRTYRYAEESAKLQARTAFDKDIIYRRWNSRLGGVYAKVTEITPPNPYLERDPERDLRGLRGDPLTKVNPAYMTRIVHELGQLSSGIVGHITSNKPIRPGNEPDPWEAKALSLLEQQDMREFAELQTMNDKKYLRLIGSLATEESCMACHAFQGYKVGEQRGGISVSVPMEPFLAQANSSMVSLSASHAGLWLFGVAFFFLGGRRLNNYLRELTAARQETHEILGTVREGLFLLDKNKKLGTQFSISLPSMLQRNIEPGMDFMPVLKGMVSKEIYESAEAYIDLLLGDRVKESLMASLNPLTEVPVNMAGKFGNVQNRWLSFFFNRVVVNGQVLHLLVTIQDVSEKVSLTQQVEQAKSQAKIEVESLLQLASGDFASLRQFIDNTGQSLSRINEKLSLPHEDKRARMQTLSYILRLIHTIKGEAAALGIDALEGYAHACEQEMVVMREDGQGNLSGEQMLRIAVLLEGFYERYSSLSAIVSRLGEAMNAKLVDVEVGHTVEAKEAGDVVPALPAQTPTAPFVNQISRLARRIATEHGKEVDVSCDVGYLSSLPGSVRQELLDVSIQLVRNALSHGIETPEERSVRKKPKAGALRLWCEHLGNGLYNFVVRDDGRGIVPERLREHLVKNGHLSAQQASAMSDKEIAQFIFQPGVSSVENADRDAGHGIGLDAVLEKVRSLNGRMLVKSRPDIFTEFHIQFSAAV